ncbi:MAG: S-formylglutathione hydrolase, partial [Synechococcaceae cyanobacterium RM1_1_27]|nr:S-formylglutathione hydrolase [Synechococcaceae cyanobacterium RM1_1_27]
QGILGHSMGGHGALVMGLRNPELFPIYVRFCPDCGSHAVSLGHQSLHSLLGSDREQWQAYDASQLVKTHADPRRPILIDQGTADSFLETQLMPQVFEQACQAAGQPLTLRRQAGYDHSYFFIATFMADHIRHHAAVLCA